MNRILICEDDYNLLNLLNMNLKNKGYETKSVSEARLIKEKISDCETDIVLIDLNLRRNFNTVSIVKELREISERLGIILLTRKSGESMAINGLNAGADDYLLKPVSISELTARITALLRRLNITETKSSDELIFGDLNLNLMERKLYRHNEEISLTALEFRLINLLIANRGKAVSKKEIFEKVWNDSTLNEKIVDVNIRRLRNKIEEDPSCPVYIKTVWGKGYKWEI
ncbi:MAG: response regulator transcription factor [Clostridia bacterium]|nr:response regulator transcription factor [Clostridia bacterium]